MKELRYWSRRAWFLHGYLIASLFLVGPVPITHSYWTDSYGNGQKQWVDDPPTEDTSWWETDSDGDYLTNAEEVLFGSDPFHIDADFDGLTDLVELNYGDPTQPLDPWNWDSDGDGYSDHDEYYQYIQGYVPVVGYATIGTFFSYYDADGDGIHNQDDGDPANMDRDGDGIVNWQDGYMDDANNGAGYGGGGYLDPDSDGDGTPDSNDPYPWGSYWWNGMEWGGSWMDADSDGTPDPADSTPYGSFWYNNVEYAGFWMDQDGDGVPDPADPWPSTPGSYWWQGTEYAGYWSDSDWDGTPDAFDTTYENSYTYNGTTYPGSWVDQDGDTIPDPADPWPTISGSYSYNGSEYPGSWSDQDGDGIPDPADPFPVSSSSYWWAGTEYPGEMLDADGDGTPDFADMTPNGSFWYNGIEYSGSWSDSDSDGIPDVADSTPSGGYWYNEVEYPGEWADSDADGCPDPADAFPNGSFWWDGTEYAGVWSDNDNDGIPNAFDGWMDDRWNGQSHYEYNGTEYPGEFIDRDGDSVPDPADSWPDDPENNVDSDGDGLSNYAERTEFHTNPDAVDTDEDFLTDHEELYIFHTDPLQAITGLADGQMVLDGYLFLGDDADADGLPDLLETYYGLDKSNPADAGWDLDNDGYTNLQAYHYGWSPAAHMDAYDQDFDGIPDTVEDAWNQICPGSLDKTIFADAVADVDDDGVMNFEEVRLGLNLASAHSRMATVHDMHEKVWRELLMAHNSMPGGSWHGLTPEILPVGWLEIADADNSGVPDGLEEFVTALNASPPPVTIPIRAAMGDFDGDGMPDEWEYRHHLDLHNPLDASDNPDGDSLPNLAEFQQGRDPGAFDDAFLEITTFSLPGGVVGQSYYAHVAASGGSLPHTFSISGNNLSSNLNLDSENGSITAIPDAEGVATLMITVTDATGMTAYREFSVNVSPAGDGGGGGGDEPPPPAVELLTTNAQLTVDLPVLEANGFTVALDSTGGTSPSPAYSFTGLPDWLRYDEATRSLTSQGVSTTPEYAVGGHMIQVTVTRGSMSGTFEREIMVRAPFMFTRDSLPPGVAGSNYSFQFAMDDISGGTTPVSYTLTSFSSPVPYLASGPSSFSITQGGLLQGQTLSVGSYSLSIKAIDAGGRTVTKNFAVTAISPEPEPPGPDMPPDVPPSVEDQNLFLTADGAVVSVSGLVGNAVFYVEDPATGAPVPFTFNGNSVVVHGAESDQGGHFEPVEVLVTAVDEATGLFKTIRVTIDKLVPDEGDEGGDPDDGGNPGEEDPPTEPGEPEEEIPELKIATINSSDETGPRYRKVGLNGAPLPDSKPQVQDESGEVAEETYVDAYSRSLRHGVSDVYVSVDSSLLPLTVRRDVTSDIWQETGGFLPQQRLDRPFGAAWSSNLCSVIRLEDKGRRASVTDEQGSGQSFISIFPPGMPEGTTAFIPVPEATSSTKGRWNTLEWEGTTRLRYTKRFGTVCLYDYCTEQIPANGAGGTPQVVRYFRLTEVRDRLGNRLVYTYPSNQRLVPSIIADPDRPGHDVEIWQDQTLPLVTKVRGPGGETTHYTYNTETKGTKSKVHKLVSVQRKDPAGTVTSTISYGYDIASEAHGSAQVVTHWHADISQITDEQNRSYDFAREINHDVKYVKVSEAGEEVVERFGVPRVLTSVTLPTIGGVPQGTTFGGSRDAVVRRFMLPNGYSTTWVNGPGGLTTYHFTQPNLYIAPKLAVLGGEPPSDDQDVTLSFTTMQIAHAHSSESWADLGAVPKETYTFNPEAGMALASATDLSGNTTVYTYAGGFDDPVTETVAYGTPVAATKTYTYEVTTRVMESVVNELGVKTLTDVEPNTGLRLAERVYATAGSNIPIKETLYTYGDAKFKGFMTRQEVKSLATGEAAGHFTDMVTEFVPDSHGRVWKQIVDPDGMASTTTTLYNGNGGKASVTDPRGNTTVFGYDGSHRLISTTFPDNSEKQIAYDAHGNVVKETNENGVSTFHAYDALNRRIKTTLDLNGNGVADPAYTSVSHSTGSPVYNGDIVVSSVTYNGRNQVLTQTDARGKVTTHTYDALGRVVSTNDGGMVTTFEYGANSGGSLFDSTGFKPTKAIDPRGTVTTNTYDARYRATTTTVAYESGAPPPPSVPVATAAVTAAQAAHAAAVASGDQAAAAVTAAAEEHAQQTLQLAQAYVPGANGTAGIVATTSTTYDALSQPLTVTDPLNRVTTNVYDALGQVIRVIEPDTTSDTTDNPTVQTFYTSFGKPWKVIDQMGNATTTTYDAAGRAVSVTSPAVAGVSAVTSTEYDAAGNAVEVTDALGRVTTTTYDVRNRAVEVKTPPVVVGLGTTLVRPTLTTTYDDLGQVLEVTDPLGAVTTTHYDNAGRKWKVEAPAPEAGASRPATVTTFDPGGLALTVTNALNQTVTNTYDGLGRLVTTVDAENITNSFEYDAGGNRTKVTDGLNQATTFVYDGGNRLVRQRFANGDEWAYAYNPVHKVAQRSPRGIVTNFTYDARDRLMTVTAPADGEVAAVNRSYTYDNAGKLLTVTEAGNAAANVSNVYDAMGRLVSESSRGQTHQYQYDLAGSRTQATYSTGRVVSTTYDALGRPKTITEGGRTTTYGYDLAGRALLLVSGNGQTSLNDYDALGRLKARTLFQTAAMAENGVQAEFNWEHDALGNVLGQHETWPGDPTRQGGIRSTVMTYDANNRLLSETIQTRSSGSAPAVDQSVTAYTYDAANNRATKTVTRVAAPASSAAAGENEVGYWDYTYNAANQLTGWEKWDTPSGTLQKSATLTYDAAGNRISQTVDHVGSGTADEVTSYRWDAQDRLLGVTMPDGSEHAYDYDYRTRRIATSSTTAGTSPVAKQTAIVFSGGLSVAEWESETGSLPVSPTVEYTRGPDMGGGVGGLLYSLRDESGAAAPKYNLSNGRGDIVAQSDQSAALTWTASYEAYGKRTKETGENKDKQRGNSKDEDPTGLLNEGFRYRDLEAGVWLSRDPAGFVDGPNVYAYCSQNPWSKFDPDGLAEIEVDPNASPEFKAAVQAQLNGEAAGSRTARNMQGGARALPNKITVMQQTLSSPAQTNVDQNGNITIRFNPREGFKTDATMSHELAHGIQLGTKHNVMQEKIKSGGKLTGPDIDAAVEAGRDALNKIVPVKTAQDIGQESKENEAMRVSNIVNAERTATDMRGSLPEGQLTGEEFWKRQLPKESVKHQNNESRMPTGTEYGRYDFKPVKETLGLDSNDEKKAKAKKE